jgi:hypothetical protein
MDLEQTLETLKKHDVAAATFDEAGRLTSVKFAAYGAGGASDSDGGGDDDVPGWRTAAHRAAGVLVGREKSMREDLDG